MLCLSAPPFIWRCWNAWQALAKWASKYLERESGIMIPTLQMSTHEEKQGWVLTVSQLKSCFFHWRLLSTSEAQAVFSGAQVMSAFYFQNIQTVDLCDLPRILQELEEAFQALWFMKSPIQTTNLAWEVLLIPCWHHCDQAKPGWLSWVQKCKWASVQKHPRVVQLHLHYSAFHFITLLRGNLRLSVARWCGFTKLDPCHSVHKPLLVKKDAKSPD